MLYVAARRDAVIGCDFPFSLPAYLVPGGDWLGFVRELGRRFPDPAAFRAHCVETTRRRFADGRVELRRPTDRRAGTPWCAWNLRLVRQTWLGISALLGPLVGDGAAVALPFQAPRAGLPWLIEVCPASLLKRLGLYGAFAGAQSYKRQAPEARDRLLAQLLACGLLAPLPPVLGETIRRDPGGDALDSLLAALAAGRAQSQGALRAAADAAESVEGRVFC